MHFRFSLILFLCALRCGGVHSRCLKFFILVFYIGTNYTKYFISSYVHGLDAQLNSLPHSLPSYHDVIKLPKDVQSCLRGKPQAAGIWEKESREGSIGEAKDDTENLNPVGNNVLLIWKHPHVFIQEGNFSLSRQSFAEIEDFMEEREISYLTGIKNDVHFLQKSWIYVGVGSNATHGVLDSCLGEVIPRTACYFCSFYSRHDA